MRPALPAIGVVLFTVLASLLQVPVSSSPALRLRGGLPAAEGKAKFPKPSRPLSALKQSVVLPDDLWPSNPPVGHLNQQFQGYLRKKHIPQEATPPERIPNVLHRIIFLGSKRDITEAQLSEVMDETMSNAYHAWRHQNQDSGFRFELYNLAKAEAYVKEHFEDNVLTAFQALQPYAYKSDMFRYLVLYNEGGWYVDLKLGMSELSLSLNELLDRVAAELNALPQTVGFVGTGQNMVWNVPGAEGVMNAFLGAKPRNPVFGDTIVRVVDDINARAKGKTPWSLTGPYALYVGLGKRSHDQKKWQDFQGGEHGVALMRFGFDEWHLPASDTIVVRKASRGECGGGWAKIGGNNYVDMWFDEDVFKS